MAYFSDPASSWGTMSAAFNWLTPTTKQQVVPIPSTFVNYMYHCSGFPYLANFVVSDAVKEDFTLKREKLIVATS